VGRQVGYRLPHRPPEWLESSWRHRREGSVKERCASPWAARSSAVSCR
jgi:hypothetical protein